MQEILIGGQNGTQVIMDAAMGNRHGMISGATGTGKTITLQILAEGFSKNRCSCFSSRYQRRLVRHHYPR